MPIFTGNHQQEKNHHLLLTSTIVSLESSLFQSTPLLATPRTLTSSSSDHHSSQDLAVLLEVDRRSAGDEEKMVFLYFNPIGWPSSLPTNEKGLFAKRVLQQKVRASHLRGDCQDKRELLRGFMKLRGHEQECVRRRVLKSLSSLLK